MILFSYRKAYVQNSWNIDFILIQLTSIRE